MDYLTFKQRFFELSCTNNQRYPADERCFFLSARICEANLRSSARNKKPNRRYHKGCPCGKLPPPPVNHSRRWNPPAGDSILLFALRCHLRTGSWERRTENGERGAGSWELGTEKGELALICENLRNNLCEFVDKN